MSDRIAVIGLGYVGLPLAVSLAKHFEVTGFDISQNRIEELKNGFDRTLEVEKTALKNSTLKVTDEVKDLEGSNIFIVTVPTPIDVNFEPDLTPLEKASQTIAP